jgi:hypothetical protein
MAYTLEGYWSKKPSAELTKMGTSIKLFWPLHPIDKDLTIPRFRAAWVPSCSRFFCYGDKHGDDNFSYVKFVRGRWSTSSIERGDSESSILLTVLGPILFGGLSLMVVGILSHFKKGTKSTSLERGFTMSWLAVGMACGYVSQHMSSFLTKKDDGPFKRFGKGIGAALMFGVFLVPSLGGFVMVGKMVLEYGSCSRVG